MKTLKVVRTAFGSREGIMEHYYNLDNAEPDEHKNWLVAKGPSGVTNIALFNVLSWSLIDEPVKNSLYDGARYGYGDIAVTGSNVVPSTEKS